MTEDEMKETIAPEEAPEEKDAEPTDTESPKGKVDAVNESENELRKELAKSREEAEQLRRERFLLLKGIPEEDLDYYVFKIGKLTEDGTAFAEATEAFLKKQEKKHTPGLFRSGAKLSGGAPRAATANETMNRLIRGL